MNALSKIYVLFIYLFIVKTSLPAQGLSSELSSRVEKERGSRIMFYNCENLFDIYDDSIKDDGKFTPEGAYHWTKSKYYKKLDNISKVITSVGGWNPPELVGLCEIENKKVLLDLTKQSSLYILNYNIIHKESPDKRGIDVALLYQPQKYKPIYNKFIKIVFPKNRQKKTRDILYSKGVLSGDTVHIFVNHWPSRWGGQLESEGNRVYVASVLRKITDSIAMVNKYSNIIIIGDFNDTPVDKSLSETLGVFNDTSTINPNSLYNITKISSSYKNKGTIKYHSKWYKFDNIIISGSLLSNDNNVNMLTDGFSIFNAYFLLEKDVKYMGYKPYRTFIGYKYNGGYSDHLPVFIDFK
jgi:hypothetical protein